MDLRVLAIVVGGFFLLVIVPAIIILSIIDKRHPNRQTSTFRSNKILYLFNHPIKLWHFFLAYAAFNYGGWLLFKDNEYAEWAIFIIGLLFLSSLRSTKK